MLYVQLNITFQAVHTEYRIINYKGRPEWVAFFLKIFIQKTSFRPIFVKETYIDFITYTCLDVGL